MADAKRRERIMAVHNARQERDFIAEYHEAETATDRQLATFRYHLARMWKVRHTRMTDEERAYHRRCIRQNLAGQRACHRQAERGNA